MKLLLALAIACALYTVARTVARVIRWNKKPRPA